MKPQLLMFFFGTFIIGTVLACLCSGRWLLNGEINIINSLASFNQVTMSVGGSFTVLSAIGTFFNGVATALLWNYPFLSDPWTLFIKIPLWLISIGVVWAFLEIGLGFVSSVISFTRSILT